MSSDAAKNAYPDPPEGFTMAGEEARLVGLREAYDLGAEHRNHVALAVVDSYTIHGVGGWWRDWAESDAASRARMEAAVLARWPGYADFGKGDQS